MNIDLLKSDLEEHFNTKVSKAAEDLVSCFKRFELHKAARLEQLDHIPNISESAELLEQFINSGGYKLLREISPEDPIHHQLEPFLDRMKSYEDMIEWPLTQRRIKVSERRLFLELQEVFQRTLEKKPTKISNTKNEKNSFYPGDSGKFVSILEHHFKSHKLSWRSLWNSALK